MVDLGKTGQGSTTYRGYMVEVEWDGHTLTARGTNKASRVALRGQDHAAGDLVLTREQMEQVTFKPANPLVNGTVVIHARDGKKYQLHFRRKQADGFRELATALGAVEA